MYFTQWAARPVRKWPAVSLVAVLMLVLMAAGALQALAHEGHDHGEKPAEAGAALVSPRIVAVSEAYQFVGIVEGEVLVGVPGSLDAVLPVPVVQWITLGGTVRGIIEGDSDPHSFLLN